MLNVRLAYADALMGVGELTKAEKGYRSTVELKQLPDQTRASLHYKLGLGLSRQGKFPEALLNWKER